MKLLLTDWQGRISPVFDSAGHFMYVQIENQEIVKKELLSIPFDDIQSRIKIIKKIRPDFIVCGAISCFYERLILDMNIQLISRIKGETNLIVKSMAENTFQKENHIMPGCRGKGFKHRNRKGWKNQF